MSQRAFLYTLAGVVIAVVIFTRIYFPTKPGRVPETGSLTRICGGRLDQWARPDGRRTERKSSRY